MSETDRLLPAPWGTRIDRDTEIEFTFEGKTYRGFAGDTIASALARNGVRTLSRSFKYHRPRGILTLAGVDGNTMVQAGPVPNLRADVTPITPGLQVLGQNYVGSFRRDAARAFDYLGSFLPVGFYYKTFFRPQGAWKVWEPIIRRMAGLGRIDTGHRNSTYDRRRVFTDVVVIGAGPAGIAAARAARNEGVSVVLIERESAIGGSRCFRRLDGNAPEVNPGDLHDVEILVGTTCTGWFESNHLTAVSDSGCIDLFPNAVVLATGELDQPAVFRNNDLPGIMLRSAVQRLLRHYAVGCGQRAIVFAADDSGYEIAIDLIDSGTEVLAIIDPRPHSRTLPAQLDGVKVLTGYAIKEAIAGRSGAVAGVRVARIDGAGEVAPNAHEVRCDLVVVSAGSVPQAQLACHVGAHLRYDSTRGTLALEVPSDLPGAFFAGGVRGPGSLASVEAQGTASGRAAAAYVRGGSFGGSEENDVGAASAPAVGPTRFPHPRGRDFIDFDEDIQVKDIRRSVAEGYADLNLVKRYTTAVMGPSQGKQSALNSMLVAREAAGQSAEGSSLTTQRPPFFPEPIKLIAGRAFDPVRRSPMHSDHLAAGAQMMESGHWLRPAWYGTDRELAIGEEVRSVRTAVGMIDVSTLGKIEVTGVDAAEFLNRIYTFAYKKQKLGTTRYLLATDEVGTIIDDGVSCRRSETSFYVTATTSGVGALYRSMLRWNAMWRLDVTVTNVTSAFAAISVAGPKSRELMQAIDSDIDLSPESFPYLAYREGTLTYVPVRLLRVGFVGELGYEIHLPAEYGASLWESLLNAGRELGIRPFGVEAQRVLRLEKGHIIVGQDTDGLTNPHHANLSWAVSTKKPFFVGSYGIEAVRSRGLDRILVGFTLSLDAPVPEENTLVVDGDRIVGRVTSAARSDTCGVVLGLAYTQTASSFPGDSLTIKYPDGRTRRAEVSSTPFYDSDLKRQAM